ncbi:MAG: hypothetical protein A2Y76_10500 [Planctomycetes bacterium RBG_13_60_9]|nr:MAG: hypothetical protein A2Y76_10500 [Planctomycetes bacterium RBG_13_60_9]
MSESVGGTNVYEAVPHASPEAVVVYCGDPRFQTAFEPFIERELGLRRGQFIPFVVGGGAGVLANPERLPKEFKFMKDRFELIHRNFPPIKRVVLINHEDCIYYRMLAQRVPGFLKDHVSKLRDRPGEDLDPIARVFHRLLAHLGLRIELYYARFTNADHSQVTFDHVLA